MTAGTPDVLESYLEVKLGDASLFVHNDLVDWNLEIYWYGTEETGRLAAREY